MMMYLFTTRAVGMWKEASVLTIIVSKDWVIKRKITQKWRIFFIIKIMWMAQGYWMLVILSDIRIISMYNMMIVLFFLYFISLSLPLSHVLFFCFALSSCIIIKNVLFIGSNKYLHTPNESNYGYFSHTIAIIYIYIYM